MKKIIKTSVKKTIVRFITGLILIQWSIPHAWANPEAEGLNKFSLKASYTINNIDYGIDGWNANVTANPENPVHIRVNIPRTKREELKKFYPSAVSKDMQDWLEQEMKHQDIRTARQTLLARTAKRFPSESFMFFLAIGAVTAAQLSVNSAMNPLAMIQHLESQKDPLTHFSFFLFMLASGFVSEPLQILYGKTVFQHFIPYIGMTAGMSASNIVHELAIIPGMISCGKARVMDNVNKDEICDKAFENFVLEDKLHQYAPMFMSLFFSNFVSGLVAGTPKAAANSSLYVLRKLGISQAIKTTAQTALNVSITGFNVILGSKGKVAARAGLGAAQSTMNFIAPALGFTANVGGKVAQFSMFVGIDQLTINYITLLYHTLRHGSSFNSLSEQLLTELDQESKSNWSGQSGLRGTLQQINKRFAKWEEAKLAEIKLANDIWLSKVNNATATYFATQKHYGYMIDDLANSLKDPNYRKITLDSVYPLNGVIPPLYMPTSVDSPEFAQRKQEQYLHDMYMNPTNLLRHQIQFLVDISRHLDLSINPEKLSGEELKNRNSSVKSLKQIAARLMSQDPKQIALAMEQLRQAPERIDSLVPYTNSSTGLPQLSYDHKVALGNALTELNSSGIMSYSHLIGTAEKTKAYIIGNRLRLALEKSEGPLASEQSSKRQKAMAELKQISARFKSGNPQISSDGIKMLRKFQESDSYNNLDAETQTRVDESVNALKTNVPFMIPGYGYVKYKVAQSQTTLDVLAITSFVRASMRPFASDSNLEAIISGIFMGQKNMTKAFHNPIQNGRDSGFYAGFVPPRLIKDSIIVNDPGSMTAFNNLWTDRRFVDDKESKSHKYKSQPVNLWTVLTDLSNYRDDVVEVIKARANPQQEKNAFLDWWDQNIEQFFYDGWLNMEEMYHSINIRLIDHLLGKIEPHDQSWYAAFDKNTRNMIDNLNPSSVDNGILASYMQQLKLSLLVLNEIAKSSVQGPADQLPAELDPVEFLVDKPLNLESADIFEILRSSESLDWKAIKGQYNQKITKCTPNMYRTGGPDVSCTTVSENIASKENVLGYVSQIQSETIKAFNEMTSIFTGMSKKSLRYNNDKTKEVIVFNLEKEEANKKIQAFQTSLKQWESFLGIESKSQDAELEGLESLFATEMAAQPKLPERENGPKLSEIQKLIAKDLIKSLLEMSNRMSSYLAMIEVISFKETFENSNTFTQKSCQAETGVKIGVSIRKNPNCEPGTGIE